MRPPSEAEIKAAKFILSSSIEKLEQFDRCLYASNPIEESITYSEIHRTLDSKLHEITINHRLAYYIENSLLNLGIDRYSVDLEYNRYYEGEKMLDIGSGAAKVVRPDILVHSRRDNTVYPQHYLVLEAKKGTSSTADVNKVKSFLTDIRYSYLFGATISYCSDPNKVSCFLYHINGSGRINRVKLY